MLVLTEREIERKAERAMDALDRRFLTTSMTQDEYDAAVREIDKATEYQHRIRRYYGPRR